ncbi:hypothetical protein DFH09DRAFT_1279549 [Mycena vulgaris]|nr:hypothetical protein DFH09DRAFT_1279549 [Mycena vulgaris]
MSGAMATEMAYPDADICDCPGALVAGLPLACVLLDNGNAKKSKLSSPAKITLLLDKEGERVEKGWRREKQPLRRRRPSSPNLKEDLDEPRQPEIESKGISIPGIYVNPARKFLYVILSTASNHEWYTIRKAKEERNHLGPVQDTDSNKHTCPHRSPLDVGIFVFASRTLGASQRSLYSAAILEPHTHRDREFASRAARCALQSVVLARDSAVRRIVLASQHGRRVGAGMQGVRDLPSGATAVSSLHRARTPHRRSLALQPMASGLAPATQTTSAPSRMCSAGAISRFAQCTRLISLAFSDDVQSRAVKQPSPTSAPSRPVPESGVATWELRVGVQPAGKRWWTVQWIAWQQEPHASWGWEPHAWWGWKLQLAPQLGKQPAPKGFQMSYNPLPPSQ